MYSQLHTAVPDLQYFKTCSDALAPEWATEHSACFDLKACLPVGAVVKAYNSDNNTFDIDIGDLQELDILPGNRVLVPTGLIFDIPIGYSMRIHPRSGLSLKKGIILANCEGVVDADYVHPTFVLLTNASNREFTITHGDRIAQAEMIPDMAYSLIETATQPTQKTNRIGGLGSTGVN